MSDDSLDDIGEEDNPLRKRLKKIDPGLLSSKLARAVPSRMIIPTIEQSGRRIILLGDRLNVCVLFFLYLLQGIPLGLSSAIPMILQNRGASYKQQAEFSFVYWPFSIKLLWAPLVDGLHLQSFGRRKTWLIPVQYLIGLFMMYLSTSINEWMAAGKEVQLTKITCLFFALNFLAATQDIVVDGWALTMLRRSNVGYASTCNSVGQTAGYFFGYVLFMALESPDFCNSYLRVKPEPQGLITLDGFLYFWGWIFILSTTLVAILKKEAPSPPRSNNASSSDDEDRSKASSSSRARRVRISVPDAEDSKSVKETYKMLWSVINLKSVRMLAVIFLTAKISFCANDAITGLKIIEAGIPKEKLAMMSVPLVPLQIALPLFISKYTNGPRPMDIYCKAYPWRLVMNVVVAVFVWYTPRMFPSMHVYYYILLLLVYLLQQVTLYSMFVSAMAFFANISDPSFGGTYMTLLNTLSNLGTSWPSTVSLWVVDYFKFQKCSTLPKNTCSTTLAIEECKKSKGTCQTSLDGYYIEVALCTLFGAVWFIWARKKINELQDLGWTEWRTEQPATPQPDGARGGRLKRSRYR